MNKKMLASIMTLSILVGCAAPKNAQVERAPGAKQVNSKQLQVEDGSFDVTEFMLLPDPALGIMVKGNVKNNTGKDWGPANFEVKVLDKGNNVLDSKIFTFEKLQQGASKPFVSYLSGRVISRVYSTDLQFVGGQHAAKYLFTMVKPIENKALAFSDRQLDIHFIPSQTRIGFALSNKTGNPIKIDWNNVAYVDPIGQTHKVIRAGVKFIDKDRPQTVAIVPPGANLSDEVLPADYVNYTSGRYGGWDEKQIFPDAPRAKDYKGLSFSLFMPLEVNGAIVNYHFVFKVEDVLM